MLDLYEFDLIYVGNKFFVKDRQGANLGDIESDAFNTLADVIDRMQIYYNDYILESIEECEENGEKVNDWDLAVKNLNENSQKIVNVDTKKFEEYLQLKGIDKIFFKVDTHITKFNNHSSTYHLFNDGEMASIYTDNGHYSIQVIGDVEVNLFANKDFDYNGKLYKKGEFIDHFLGDGYSFAIWLEQYTNNFLERDLLLENKNPKYKLDFELNNWYESFFYDLDGEEEYSMELDACYLSDAITEVEDMIQTQKINHEIWVV